MGLAKQYLRYRQCGLCNVIGSTRAGLVLLHPRSSRSQLCAAVGSCEHVRVWNLRKGEAATLLEGADHEVSSLVASPNEKQLAVGYLNGSVKLFSVSSGECTVTFNGHRKEVRALNYDHHGMRLVSGCADTGVVIWDIVNESGLFRLRGHTKEVMQARFLHQKNFLMTCSKDETIKMWDLDTQHCFKTILGHTTEVWDFVLAKDDSLLITGSKDMDMRVWKLSYNDQNDINIEGKPIKTEDDDNDEDDGEGNVSCVKIGSVLRQGKGHVVSMSLSADGTLLGCHGTDAYLEIFKIPSDEELRKLSQKRIKKAKKKAERDNTSVEEVGDIKITVDDEVRRLARIRMSAKIRAFQFHVPSDGLVKVVGLLCNNSLESYSIDPSERKPIQLAGSKLTMPGHRTDVRTVCFSSDNTAIATGSAESLRVWNRTSLQCIRTMESEYALCSLFAPGDRHFIIGTMSGKLQIFDIAVGGLIETIDAHSQEVWSIFLAPDKRGIISGSQDKEVKFWDFELASVEGATTKTLTLVHRRTLQMSSEVLAVKYSADHKFLAVALMDSTVKVFFADTLKFFLSLYGHKLPVLSLDISTDATILVTGSQDKNVYIWGLDFGNIHKRLFAHDGSVTSIQFVPKTHIFFSAGKDRKLKQWDADTFQHITTLEGHQADIWCIAVSPSGNYVASGAHDRSLRVWEKTDEIMVLEEEQEKEREREMDEKLGTEWDDKGDNMDVIIPGESNVELAKAGKKSKETDIEANRLLEALDLYQSESEVLLEHQQKYSQLQQPAPAPPIHLMFQAFGVKTPNEYVLEVIKRIKSSELEEALLVLPLSYVTSLLKLLNEFIESGLEVELSSRCLLFLLRIHCVQITSNQVLMPIIDKLRTNMKTQAEILKDRMGFNLAGLSFLKQQLEERTAVTLFADATRKQRKRKRAVLTLRT